MMLPFFSNMSDSTSNFRAALVGESKGGLTAVSRSYSRRTNVRGRPPDVARFEYRRARQMGSLSSSSAPTASWQAFHDSASLAEAFLDEQAFLPGLLGVKYHRYPIDAARTQFVMFVEPRVEPP